SKYVSFSLLGAIGVLLTPIFGSIVAAGLTEYYPDSVLKLDVKNRPDGEEEKMEIGKSYTACSYNIGYGALNQGTYTFADTGSVSSYIYGKARASSKAEVNFSVNGLENIINDGHDTNGVFWPNQLENKTFKSNELTKEYMKQEGENTYRAEPDNQLSDRPIEDFHGSVVYKTSYDSDSKKPTKDEQLTADEAINEENLPGKFDLVGLQEIDRNSTRSYDVDMYDQITNDLGSFNSSYAVNYSVPWCPIPLLPLNMGQIESGVAALSKFQINDATRYSLDSINTPIYRYMTLKRCILENRIPLYKADGEETGKYLIFIVTHLDAYDNGGAVRSAQLKLLDDIMYEEYNSGNYVIACADWNCTLPDTHGYEGDINDLEDDQPIASFDYREDDPSKISYTNPKNDQFYE
ncbi:MAG: hypothetical protein K2M43_01990, partial [Mycoplasmoidaceae bacterium]|nr:hypothetical protein [Mycoplasmoidaceae bacterium]